MSLSADRAARAAWRCALLAAGALALHAPAGLAAAYTVTPCAAGITPFPGSGLLSADGGTVIEDRCAAGGGFRMTFTGNRILAGQEFGFRLGIPAAYPNARILRLTGVVSFAARSGDAGAFGVIDETNGGWDASTGGTTRPGVPDFPLPAGPAIIDQAFGQSPVRPTRSVIWRLASSGTSTYDASALGANAVLKGLSVDLDDSTRPAAAVFQSTGLLDGAPQTGKRILSFTASDEDSGAHTAVVRDGTATVGSFSGDCRWVSVQACPSERRIDAVVDTTKMSDGPHTVSITTYDAANNARTDVSPRFVVANGAPPSTTAPTATPAPGPGLAPPNGDPRGTPVLTAATRATKAQARPAKVRRVWGRPVVLSGRLLAADGTAMPGITLDVTRQLTLRGAPRETVGSIVTGADGRYRYTFRAMGSATYAVRYPLHLGAEDWAAAAMTNVVTQAKVTLQQRGGDVIRRGVVRRFTGTVEAGAVPPGGTRVAIQYHLARGGWLNADVLTTTDSGSFTWKHAFRTKGVFRLRARVLSDRRLAAAPAHSRELRFRVR